MATDYVITVTALDRVGIIAAVSDAVLELNGNIDALSQTVMSGYFTIILTARFATHVGADELEKTVESRGKAGELGVQVRRRDVRAGSEKIVPDSEKFILTITGEDRKGVIERVTSYLAGRNVNIEDLYARADEGGFLMVAQLQMPSACNVESMQLDLGGLWPDEEVRVSLQHENIFLATNQIDFTSPQ